MIPVTYFRERVHGRRIPTGKPLANLIQAILGQAALDAIRQLRMTGHVDLSRWIPSFAEAARPMLLTFFQAGQKQRARELLAAIENRRRIKGLRKAISWPMLGGSPDSIVYGFNVFNPKIINYIDNATFALVESTLKTAAEDAMTTYAKLRQELGASLRSGEGIAELNRRIYGIFRDPDRAAKIGQTEASRAQNGGAYMAAQEAGVTHVRWLASSDACRACLRLNGQERKLGEPFVILPKAKPPYQIVMHPPLHPWCFCVTEDLLGDAVIDTKHDIAYA